MNNRSYKTKRSQILPDTSELMQGLNIALDHAQVPIQVLEILDRGFKNYPSGTHLSEVITCQLPRRTSLQLFVKYSCGLKTGGNATQYDTRGDHRRGVAYEAAIYNCFLSHSSMTVPKFYGMYRHNPDIVCLFLEYLDNTIRITKASESIAEGIIKAAAWLGTFHAANERLLPDAQTQWITKHDADYYKMWAKLAFEFLGLLDERLPHIEGLCGRFEEIIPLLTNHPTLIHGEFYPKNILVRDGIVYPVDWEAAAIGNGAVDLAALTERWSVEFTRLYVDAYRQARCPRQSISSFSKTLDAARLYWRLRWIANSPGEKLYSWQLEELETLGARLELI